MSMVKYEINSDNALVILLKEGDKVAYTEIYNRYFLLMFRFAYRKLQDEELAKDFVQELFTTLWHKREKVLPEGNLAQFLYIKLRSNILNHYAHQKVETKYIDFLANFANAVADNADHKIRESQLKAYIDRQISKLPPQMRKIFRMSREEQLSNREIASKLETTESNISKQIGGAKEILGKKIIKGYD
jgi:RNA polymerase sigma-70 factor (family 1)